jgi:type VI secretion system protein ImpA
MSDNLSKPPVIDLDAIFQPVSEELPSGESLRYSGLYDEIAEARRADMDVSQGEWQTELKVADFRKVVELGVPALVSQSKDLQIAAWLSEALVKIHGFAGLRDSLTLLAGLQDKFWETLHPEIDEGEMSGRANAIAWLDAQASMAIMGAAITSSGYGLLDFEDSKKYDFPENVDLLETSEQVRLNELKAQAEAQRKVTGEMWRRSVTETNRAFCETTNLTVDECWTAFNELNRVIEEKYDRNQMPGLSELKKSLDSVQTQVKKLLEEKRAEEPDESDLVEGSEGESAEGGAARQGTGAGTATGAIQSRLDALKRLGDIAEFFQKTEPHSPVAYLVQRAVKWGNMPLENWLQDVIKDESVLFQLRQTLGLNTGMGESVSDDY